MRKHFYLVAAVAVLTFSACENANSGHEAEVTDAKQVENTNEAAVPYAIDTNASKFKWEGHKKLNIGDSHQGTVNLKSGEVMIAGNKVTGGTIVMDMNSINNIDLEGKDEYQTKLVNHLKSDEFFDVAKFPTSKFEITSVKDSNVDGKNAWVEGNLTIKNSTQNIGFPADIKVENDEAHAKAKVVIDRSKFDVRYGSENFFKDLAGDKIISNDITLDIDLVAKKKQ